MRKLLNRAILTVILVMQLSFVGLLLAPASVSAATAGACSRESSSFLDFPTWYKYLNPRFDKGDPNAVPPRPAECKIEFPKNAKGKEDITLAIGPILLAVFEIILRVAGLAAVVFVIWGGIQYQLSQGEPDRAKSARTVLINALIGLAIAVSATAIVNLVGRSLS